MVQQRSFGWTLSGVLQGILAIALISNTGLPVKAQTPGSPSQGNAVVAQRDLLPRRASPPAPDRTVECELLIVGGGLSGTAAAYEALLHGQTVCMTELTDWMGGQITSQGTSALDEANGQRRAGWFAKGYLELRHRIRKRYGMQNPGDCWVSASCFLPRDAERILEEMVRDAAQQGRGKLHWFPSTVIKELEISPDGKQIMGAIAIQHAAAPGTAPLNTEPLSHIIEDAYQYADSPRLTKQIIRFQPRPRQQSGPADWYVIEATETGELIALADVPYRLGLDPRSHRNPSSPSIEGDPYCTQGFTYTFAMEQTADPQPQEKPAFYDRYAPYYGFDPNPSVSTFDAVFTYRRIWSPAPRSEAKVPRFGVSMPKPGDISMQNWVWGNDYRPGTAQDNLIYSRNQLVQRGDLAPGGWRGGLRTETLRAGEELALGFYYWLVEGTTNSQPAGNKQRHPNHRLLQGLESPMGTVHGLSKYPYIREGRRIIGRPAYGYAEGFTLAEIDISRADYSAEYFRRMLSPEMYRHLWVALAGLQTVDVLVNQTPAASIQRRTRSTIYPDAVGIAQYAIDFHPCMALSPPEAPGNTEREGTRTGHGQAYPGQIPLRAMIPQTLDNMLVTGKSIATSHLAAAAYRVHSFEWSAGVAAAHTARFALREGVLPYQLVDDLPRDEPLLRKLQAELNRDGNPTSFPNTSVFNLDWSQWRVW
ncbi:MAG TPA: FAD-dependent oxidoreductase [Synechococcales cyanobacterium M55_K2018_004]|nr:FAD-dependent oxidoreductase [Synechococcales cyanobacterium M55_K2018_004]